jgi:hypothetical protein
MSRREMIALKLQMGINPSTHIAPDMLLAMWHQLKLESVQTQADQSKAKTDPNQMTSSRMIV